MTPDVLAAHWGDLASPARLIGQRENAVYEVRFTSGTRAALRLHRAGYQTAAAITAELHWTESLATSGFPCPLPLRTLSGDLLAQVDGHIASVVSWIDAPCIGISGAPFDGTAEQHVALYHQLGALLRRLHNTTDGLSLPDLPRPRWDIDGLTGDTPLWGRFWENPTLGAAERATLSVTRSSARAALTALPAAQIGLIHGDALQENVLARDGQMWLIDFDDSGYGYRGYDLAVALSQHVFAPERPALCAALLDGYGDPVMAEHLPLFALLRACASCGWIVPRSPAGDPRQRLYAERALYLARDWLETT